MIPYLIVITISSLGFFLGGYCWEKGSSRMVGYLFCALSIALLCLFAGCRDSGVGTDTIGYGDYVYQAAINSASFPEFQIAVEGAKWEIGFLFSFQGYLTSKITHNIIVYYSIIELLITLPVFLSIKEYCDNRFIAIPLLLWLLVFYPASFNLMRQFIAVGFVLLAYVCLDKNHRIKCIILSIVAYLFHSTAICVVVFFLARFLLVKKTSIKGVLRKHNRLISLAILVFAVTVCLNVGRILAFAAQFSSSLAYYAGYTRNDTGDLGLFFYLFYAVTIVGLILLSKRIDKRGFVYILIFAMSVLFYMLGNYVTDVSRMNYYSLIFAVIPVAMYMDKPSKISASKFGMSLCLLAAAAYFVWTYGVQGAHEVIPYTTSIFMNGH